jgi:hypothetical protein
MTDDLGMDRLHAAVLARRGGARPRHLRSAEPIAAVGVNRVELVRDVYWSTARLLMARGMNALSAGRVALRTARMVLLTGDMDMRCIEVARELKVSDRQIELDRGLVRGLGRGVLESPSSGLPRIPTPSDRIVVGGSL